MSISLSVRNTIFSFPPSLCCCYINCSLSDQLVWMCTPLQNKLRGPSVRSVPAQVVASNVTHLSVELFARVELTPHYPRHTMATIACPSFVLRWKAYIKVQQTPHAKQDGGKGKLVVDQIATA